MAVPKPDIQYISQFFVPGAEAQVIEFKPAKQKRERKTVLPIAVPEQKIEIRVDPIALCGIIVAVTMIILMAVGVSQYLTVCHQYEAMADQVIDLQNENLQLREEFKAGYDLEDIRTKALGIGMIPIEEATTVAISVVIPEPEPEPTMWDNIVWFMKGLFA